MTNMQTSTRGKGRVLLLAGLSAVALLGAAAGITRASAHPHGDGWSTERMEHRADDMLKRVDATPDQLTKVHAILPADRERIFEPFYRPAGHAEGSGGWGLGLALVRQIAVRHGATVRCEAPPEGGTAFVVEFDTAARPDKAARWKNRRK